MKILHVAKKYPNALGGDATVVQNLEREQTKNGNRVFILTTNCDEIINKKNLIKFGLKDTPPNLDKITVKRLISLIDLRLKFPNILRKIKPDVVHCHSIDMGYIISPVCKKFNIPIVNQFHTGLFMLKDSDNKRGILEKYFINKSKFDKIISVNPNDVENNKSLRIRYIPNGISLSEFNGQKKKKNIIFTLLFVGRIDKLKGLTYLFEAISQLKSKSIRLKLNIVGGGNGINFYKNMVNDLSLEDYITFSGKKFGKDLKEAYNKSDVFILPSLDEGFPVSLLEAWSTKTPTIITSVGAVSKICTNNYNALVIGSRDTNKITKAIQHLIGNPKLREKLAKNGLKEVKKYSWKKITWDIEKIYLEIAK